MMRVVSKKTETMFYFAQAHYISVIAPLRVHRSQNYGEWHNVLYIMSTVVIKRSFLRKYRREILTNKTYPRFFFF
jgi:hypothetical protein